jgi:hypothetical protein
VAAADLVGAVAAGPVGRFPRQPHAHHADDHRNRACRSVRAPVADEIHRIRPRLARLCGRCPRRCPVRGRRAAPSDPDPGARGRHGGPGRAADRGAVWRPRLRGRLPVRAEGPHRRDHRGDRLDPRRTARRVRRGIVRNPLVGILTDRRAGHGSLCRPDRLPIFRPGGLLGTQDPTPRPV